LENPGFDSVWIAWPASKPVAFWKDRRAGSLSVRKKTPKSRIGSMELRVVLQRHAKLDERLPFGKDEFPRGSSKQLPKTIEFARTPQNQPTTFGWSWFIRYGTLEHQSYPIFWHKILNPKNLAICISINVHKG
jgi:hypothetical protein